MGRGGEAAKWRSSRPDPEDRSGLVARSGQRVNRTVVKKVIAGATGQALTTESRSPSSPVPPVRAAADCARAV